MRRKKKKCEEKLDAPTSQRSITRALPGISITVTWYSINWRDSQTEMMAGIIEEYLKILLKKLPRKRPDHEPVHRGELGE